MSIRRISSVVIALGAAAGVAACGSSSSTATHHNTTAAPSGPPATINGSGSTLAAPIYQQWGSTLKNQNLTVNYNPVGSGAGQTQLASGVTNFAGSDPALKPADEAKFTKGTPLQFPVAFGAITVSYNLSGVKSGMKLDGPVIAEIFMGKIKTWNDSAIKALNPGLSLPSMSITVVHRSDSSGTTDGFTKYLSAVSPTWKSQIGHGKDVVWPTGTGAKGNSGVAAAVHQTAGSVGYVEQAYALLNGFTYAAVKNSAGSYVEPTITNTSAAASGITIPSNLGISTINSPNASAYPIVSQTFLMTYKDPCKAGASSTVASGIKRWLTYAFGAGQKTFGSGSNQLPYAALPSDLVSKNEAQLATMTCNGSAIS